MAGENDTHQGFDDEGIVNFLFYTFLLNPICHYILSPARKWKRSTAIYLVAGFISFIALSNLYLMLVDSGLNHYQLLEVTRSSSVIDIRKSYKKLILEVHPDKNPNPAAPEQFSKVKAAYDVLMDMENREIYNKLGEGAIKHDTGFNEMDQTFAMGIYYVVNAALTYLTTIGKKYENARTWTCCALILMFAIEVALVLGGLNGLPDLPSWFLPQWTQYEIVQTMHSLYPAFMNGCRLVSSSIFVDIEAQTRSMLVQLLQGHNMLLTQLRNVEVGIGKLRNNGVHKERNSGVIMEDTSPSSSILHFENVTTKLMEMEKQKIFNKSGIDKLIGEISDSNKSRYSIPFPIFWVLLAIYAAFFYFTDN